MSSRDKYEIPPVTKISKKEAESIMSMFKFYDYTCTGRIPQRLVLKLLRSLGFSKFTDQVVASEMSLKDLLLFIDIRCPEPEPALPCALYSYLNIVAKELPDGTQVITQKDMSAFSESIGHDQNSASGTNMLLTSMLAYNDCSETPAVNAEFFERDIQLLAKSQNLLKHIK